MKKSLALASLLALSACSSMNRLPTNYSGTDAGYVVIGVGATTQTDYSRYTLLFRKTGLTKVGRFSYASTKASPTGYKANTESGVVEVHTLPPGNYEVYNFDIAMKLGNGETHLTSKTDFSIPFTIRPGQVTYLGNYLASQINGKDVFGQPIPTGVVFVVEDREEHDVYLAAKQKPGLTSSVVTDGTPQIKAIKNPYFVERPQP